MYHLIVLIRQVVGCLIIIHHEGKVLRAASNLQEIEMAQTKILDHGPVDDEEAEIRKDIAMYVFDCEKIEQANVSFDDMLQFCIERAPEPVVEMPKEIAEKLVIP